MSHASPSFAQALNQAKAAMKELDVAVKSLRRARERYEDAVAFMKLKQRLSARPTRKS